ncbi:hypothetical protein V5799_020057 [Amblyomma americanum]|uniref:Uncharacterized protein n=1 Tax=Amblyomma americanum TaxID=6943 RepID=A0AAQ4EVB9_AMBAM
MTTTATTATEAASLGAFSTPPDLTGPHDQGISASNTTALTDSFMNTSNEAADLGMRSGNASARAAVESETRSFLNQSSTFRQASVASSSPFFQGTNTENATLVQNYGLPSSMSEVPAQDQSVQSVKDTPGGTSRNSSIETGARSHDGVTVSVSSAPKTSRRHPIFSGPPNTEASPPAPPAPYNGSTRSYTTLTTERPAGYSTTTAGYNRTASYSKDSVPSSSSNTTAHTTTEESASGSTYSSVFPVKSRPHSTTAQIDEYYYDEVSSGNETEAFRNDVPNPYDEVLPEIVPYEADITEKSEVLTNEYGNKFVAYTRKAPLQPGLGKKYSVPKRPQTSFDPLNTPSLLPDSTSLYADEDYAEVAPRFSAGNSGRNGRSDEYSASNGKSRGGKRVVPNPAMRKNTSSLFSQTAVLLEYQSTYDQQGSR